MCIGNIIDDDGGIIIMSCVVQIGSRVDTQQGRVSGPGGYCGRRGRRLRRYCSNSSNINGHIIIIITVDVSICILF